MATPTLEAFTVAVCAAAVPAPSAVIAVTSSLSFVVVLALDIPVATDTTPVPAVAPVARAIVGCVVTLTPVNAEAVVAVPSPVMTVPPLPFAERLPVATVLAVPRVTLDAVFAVPRVVFVAVTSEPLPPPMMRVSASSPVPIVNVQVLLFAVTEVLAVMLGTLTSVFPVTFGTVVVASLLVAPGYDFTKVSVPSAPTAVPDAVALILVVAGVTVVVNVALLPRALSVVWDANDTADDALVTVVPLPRTLVEAPLFSVTEFL